MRGRSERSRGRLAVLVLVWLAVGCSSVPFVGTPLPADSSLLAIDVRFPVALGRDPSLVGVFLVRGPIHAGLERMPRWIPATFVKGSRAYLLDPTPGTYSVVAVSSYHAPARSPAPHPLASGVTGTVSVAPGTGEVVVLDADTIRATRTTIGPAGVEFMGALEVVRGERINAETRFGDHLQARIAEGLRPGVTSESGVGGLFTMTWTADPRTTSLRSGETEWIAFLIDAEADLGASPWADFVAASVGSEASTALREPVPRQVAPAPPAEDAPVVVQPDVPGAPPVIAAPSAAGASAPTSVPVSSTGAPEAAPLPTPATPAPAPGPSGARATPVAPVPTTSAGRAGPAPAIARATRPRPALPRPKPQTGFPGVPAGHRFAQIVSGMTSEDVQRLLGDPQEREQYQTARAWIPFYTGTDGQLIDWRYAGEGRVVFSMDPRTGALEVKDVRYDPRELE